MGMAIKPPPYTKQTINVMEENVIKQKMSDVLVDISIGRLSMRYFGKSPSWLYHKINRAIVNGKPAEFTADEVARLKNALHDIAGRIERVAEAL